ncbi:hypothetical protein Dda_3499 [Drechslerella dactyloides]|uniref:RRM Nup35-type domain-containing protein n=1 Tax=Drechslerella dactyloides TaxID=74499 RepID=A0AAD6IY22_DREDA|nr:hypothetical protein Dda_3499 [Drechslerella dactyloides]
MNPAGQPSGPRNPEEMSHMMSEFYRQSLIQQQPIDQSNQPSTGYGLFSMQASVHPPLELEPSQRTWPQSEFVTSVIEAPIEHANPGWRDHESVTASSLRQRAEAGMQTLAEARGAQSIFQKSRAHQAGSAAPGTSIGAGAPTHRDNRKTIPSHLTHMKYKGYDPTELEGSGPDSALHRGDHPPKGTASFGSKARRRTDAVSLMEEEQKRKDMEQQFANFPPILPGCLFNTLSEEEAESRRAAVEDDMRLKWNIPARPSSPTLTRRSTYNKHGGPHRRTSISMPQEDRGYSSGFGASSGPSGALQTHKLETERQPTGATSVVALSDHSTYASVKVKHPLLITNNNTWNHILDHMLNHGNIVNPFNHKAKFRLRACFPPGTPIDILASGDTRQSEYPANLEMLRQANEVVMGPDWIKMTYENESQATAALNSNGVHFDGFPLEVSGWNEADDLGVRANATMERPRWMLLSAETANASSIRKAGHSGVEPAGSASQGHDRQLLVLHDEAIFLKHPGVVDRIKELVYGYLFQSTAKYDEEGNYVKGSGGVLLDLWHLLMS